MSTQSPTQTTGTRDRVLIFDTTLRDGEQCPGATMTFDEKLAVAELLDTMGVDIIEAGFPIASIGDFEAVSEIARRTKRATIAGLARAITADIARAGEAVRHAQRGRIHTFVSTSPIHLAHQMRKTQDEVLEIILKTVAQARDLVEDVEWSAMDATRTPIDYLCRCVEAAIKRAPPPSTCPTRWATLRPPSTGTCSGRARAGAERRQGDLLRALPQRPRPRHRELAGGHRGRRPAGGMHHQRHRRARGQRGARRDRDGDPHPRRRDALRDGHRIADADPRLEAREPCHELPVQFNKAIVGRNAFAHESGIHQDGMLKNSETYEIMTPASVGLTKTSLVMGKHSGRAAFRSKLDDLGLHLSDNQFQDAFERFKALADRKKHVYDEDIEALVDENLATAQDRIRLVSLSVIAGTRGPQRATLRIQDEAGSRIEEADGNGPVDAVFNAIRALVPHEAQLDLYDVHAVTGGTDAQAEVTVRLRDGDRSITARGADPDTLVASAKAYLSALNKLSAQAVRLHAQHAAAE